MINKVRLAFQSLFLILVSYVALRPLFDKSYLADVEAYCPFGGLASLFSKLEQSTMACNMSETQVFLGIGLVAGAGLIGKLFCSFVCPIGTVSEWLGRLGDKFKLRRELPAGVDRYLRVLKYLLLFITIYFTMTSSELFCKKFDPYFFVANGFSNPDIVLGYAIPVLLITVAGALFFRLFWCKYLCPLGAMTNIFMNVGAAGTVVVVFLLANFLGAALSYVWLLAGLGLVGLVTEVGFMRSFLLPVPKIRRVDASCSDCGFCDDKCPQGIQISTMNSVNHIDCNLCSDCVHACPLKNVLTIQKRNNLKHFAPVAVVVLIALSLTAASFYEFTTISPRWGSPSGPGAVYTQSGIKNVKCYGSSMTLAGMLEGINGIYGLDTYAKSHTVKVYYDPAVISEQQVRASLFTPSKIKIREFQKTATDSLTVLTLGIYGLFDQVDFNNLYSLVHGAEGIYGYEARYGEPVMVELFFDPALLTPREIRALVEKKSIVVTTQATSQTIELDFRTEDEGTISGKLNTVQYNRRMFISYDDLFNNYEQYKPEQLSVLIFPWPESEEPAMREQFSYLVSHLSAYEGIVRFSTRYIDTPSGCIVFDPAKTTVEEIRRALTAKRLKYFISETDTEERDNPFQIDPTGRIVKATMVNLDEETGTK